MTKFVEAKPEHEVVYQELCDLVKRHAHEMSAEQVLAIAANMLGKFIAMQDQRKYTMEQVMEIVAHNMEKGNQQVVEQLKKSQGTA